MEKKEKQDLQAELRQHRQLEELVERANKALAEMPAKVTDEENEKVIISR